jgi:hypothetical protein
MQITDTVLMIRPAAFSYNTETAANNFFQQTTEESIEDLQAKVLQEFDAVVNTLRSKGIHVMVIDDIPEPPKPDAIFPNNWMTTNPQGLISLFPMYAHNRRTEKRDDIIQQLQQQFVVSDFHDWTEFEAEAMYLEGTGSMVMDHQNKIIYAALSPRTHPGALQKFAATNGYRAMAFTAVDEQGRPLYHTNVMMSVGEGFAVLCPKSIADHMERIAVAQLLEATGHENIYVEPEVMQQFACNLLQLKNSNGQKFVVLSQNAMKAIPSDKLERLQQYGELIPVDVTTIERVNGGSVRCMLAEIFLKEK